MAACHLNHVGVGVADVDQATIFYRAVFGCRVLRPPFEVRGDGPNGAQPRDVLKPPTFKRMRMAHLVAANGIGIELFQLIDPPYVRREPPLEYWKSGLFHFSMTVDDIEETLAALTAAGGSVLSKIWINDPEDPFKRMVYCADPWGTIIELYSHSYIDMYARDEGGFSTSGECR